MNLMLDWLLDGIVISVVATLAMRLVPSTSAAQRHTFGWLALLAVLALPGVSWLVSHALVAVQPDTFATEAFIPVALTLPAPPSWTATVLGLLWGSVAVLSLTRLARELRAVRRLAADARPLTPGQEARFPQFLAARASNRTARVCVSSDIRGACAVGYVRPCILLSSHLVSALDGVALEAIVLHEYAHLQRYDDWTRLVQRAVLAVAGVHPGVRWLSRQIDIEREAACDRLVVEQTGAVLAYATSLTLASEIASRTRGLTPVVAPGVSMTGGGLHARVSRLLTAPVVSRRRTWASATIGAATLSAAVAAAAVMPPLVVISSLGQPLAALTRAPLGLDVPLARPVAAAEARPAVAAAPATSTVRRAFNTPTFTAGPSGVVRQTSPLAPQQGGEPHADPPGEPVMPLEASASIAPALLAPIGAVAAPERTSDAGFAARAARAGSLTGEAGARAGASIGRFFRGGSRAIAQRF